MPIVRKSVIGPHTCAAMFALVDGVVGHITTTLVDHFVARAEALA